MAQTETLRVLVVDAEPGLIEDYRLALCPDPDGGGAAGLLASACGRDELSRIELSGCLRASDAIEALGRAAGQRRPFALAFVDPRGVEGLEAVARMRALDPDLRIVVVSAAPDIDLAALNARVPPADRLFYLRKPFHVAEIRQLTLVLSAQAQGDDRPTDGGREAAEGAALPELPPAGILVFDAGDRLISANRTMSGLFPVLAELFVPGTRYQEIQWQMARQLLPDDTLYRVHSWVRDRLDWHTGGGGVLEQRLRGPRWILLAEARGERGKTYCHFHDVTALKRREGRRAAAVRHAQLSQAFAGLCDRLQLEAPRMRRAGGTVVSLRAGSEDAPGAGAEALTLPGAVPSDLIDRLLAIAQRQKLLPRAVDLAGTLAGLVQDGAADVPAGIEVEFVADPGLWPALVDPDGLASALRELVRNACDAMPGGGRLVLEAVNARPGSDRLAVPGGSGYGHYVRLSVRDSGCGMSPEFAERAVTPFFTTRPGDAHPGLGLSAVYGFMSQSGGRMEFAEADPNGTRVDLYLPRAAVIGGARELVERAARGYAQPAAMADD
jgi:CheY-like chemotaxis protein